VNISWDNRPVTVERLDLTGELGSSPGYAYAAKASGTSVYTAGAVPVDRTGTLIAPDDLEGQTRAVIANLETALKGAGASSADVVKTTIYVVGEQSDLPRAWRVFAEHPLSHAPSTLVGVTQLGYSGQLIEIEATAVID
jgi:enamine deaminase RidA (YjgF/YER057c/UK114 family)